MMFLLGRDGFKTMLQTAGEGKVTYTSSDDLVVVIGTIQAEAAELGMDVRVFPGPDRTLVVVPREPDRDNGPT